ncbi:MAG: hypothetical protein QM758_05165 [Armatimonas sp.]
MILLIPEKPMPSTAVPSSSHSQEVLDSLVSTADAAQEQAQYMAQTATQLYLDANHFEVVETLATQLQSDAIDIQLRLDMIQDAAVTLGATRLAPLRDTPAISLRPQNTPAARQLLEGLANVAELARRVDEEMGWLDDQGRPNGYYERYAIAHLLLRTTLEDTPSLSI